MLSEKTCISRRTVPRLIRWRLSPGWTHRRKLSGVKSQSWAAFWERQILDLPSRCQKGLKAVSKCKRGLVTQKAKAICPKNRKPKKCRHWRVDSHSIQPDRRRAVRAQQPLWTTMQKLQGRLHSPERETRRFLQPVRKARDKVRLWSRLWRKKNLWLLPQILQTLFEIKGFWRMLRGCLRVR